MKHAAEFSRPIEVDRIPRKGTHEIVTAAPDELHIIAEILKLPSVQALKAKIEVTPWQGGGIKVKGEVTIAMTLQSVVSLEDFEATETYSVERYFSKRAVTDDDTADIDPLPGRLIDLGAIVLETIGLELDPYPRKPGEVFASAPEPEPDDGKVTPFAKLSADLSKKR